MSVKRCVELGFLIVFALGVVASIWLHQSYDEWLKQLVQASAQKVSKGRAQIDELTWQPAEQKLHISGIRWMDTETANTAWLAIPESTWAFAANSWQGAMFTTDSFTFAGVSINIQQEGLSTNINRLIKQVESVQIQLEKPRKGKEPLMYKVSSCVLRDVQINLTTLKHGRVNWHVPEIVLSVPSDKAAENFDATLRQYTLLLLYELKKQSTDQLIKLVESKSNGASVDAALNIEQSQ